MFHQIRSALPDIPIRVRLRFAVDKACAADNLYVSNDIIIMLLLFKVHPNFGVGVLSFLVYYSKEPYLPQWRERHVTNQTE
jgi:hypothetical protein